MFHILLLKIYAYAGIISIYSTLMGEQFLIDALVIDCSLSAMQLMLVYDTVPMLGYDIVKFRDTFDTPDNLINIPMIAIG